MWVDEAGNEIDAEVAEKLLTDIKARQIAKNTIHTDSDVVVVISTTFTGYVEDHDPTPKPWETLIVACRIIKHRTRADAISAHDSEVERARVTATRHGVLASEQHP